MSNAVRRPKEYEQMLEELCNSDKGIFLTYKHALVFAACLGYKRGKRITFKKSSEPIRLHIFKGDYDESIFQGLALCETKDPSIMSDDNQDRRINIFEEYAAGGLEIIKSRIHSAPEGWLVAIESLINEQYRKDHGILDDLTEGLD